MPLWGDGQEVGVLKAEAYIEAPHWEYGGVFGGVPPRYVRFDPPLKS